MRHMLSLFAVLVLLFASPAKAGDAVDEPAIRNVITKQLEAFAADRDAEAYSYAAPVIKFAFPTVGSFMAMVKQGYQPVHRNNGYTFSELKTAPNGSPMQTVIIRGVDGKTYEARYTLERQEDGTWKIAGCMIIVLPGTEA